MMAAVLTCGFAFTACSVDDDDPVTPAASKLATADVLYSIKIDGATRDAIKKAFTFTVEYYDQDGSLVKSEPLKYGNTEWTYGPTITKFPAVYGMRITVAPKEDLSGIGDGETFDIVYDCMVNGVCKDTEGKVLDNQSTGKKTVKYQDIDVKPWLLTTRTLLTPSSTISMPMVPSLRRNSRTCFSNQSKSPACFSSSGAFRLATT
ncbi:MAG: hypothetical protein K6D37_03395 [Prevotella sp.]|nr:hypothetical protein [Prevotella sp.]